MTFTNAKRIQTSILSGPEKATLIWPVNRTPRQINSDHLTALGLIAMLGVGFGYWLSASRPAVRSVGRDGSSQSTGSVTALTAPSQSA